MMCQHAITGEGLSAVLKKHFACFLAYLSKLLLLKFAYLLAVISSPR